MYIIIAYGEVWEKFKLNCKFSKIFYFRNFQSQTQSISGLVNQTLVTDLQAMGYSKVVSEKSLLLTQNISIQAALDWIEANQGIFIILILKFYSFVKMNHGQFLHLYILVTLKNQQRQ